MKLLPIKLRRGRCGSKLMACVALLRRLKVGSNLDDSFLFRGDQMRKISWLKYGS
jgi:hypothetical protein